MVIAKGGVSRFDNDYHYTEVASVNPTCHPYEVGEMGTIIITGIKLWKHNPLVEADEK